MFWNSMAQEWYLGDEHGYLTVWSIYRDSLIKDHQLSDAPITCTTNYENPLGSLHAEVRPLFVSRDCFLTGSFAARVCSDCVTLLAASWVSSTSTGPRCLVK
jgi:hypothetical protein